MNFLFEDIKELKNFIECKDLCPSGIPRFGVSPLVNVINILIYEKKDGFKTVDTECDNYIISAGVNHSPDDWTGYNPRVKSLFNYLNEKYVNDLRSGKALLMLDQSFEGYQTHWLWEWFHQECSYYNIPPQSIVYVTGNMIAEEVYTKWADDNNVIDRIKPIGYPHFEIDVAMNAINRPTVSNQLPLPTFEEHVEYKSKNQIKTFACLNKRIRPHRVWFYNYLFHSGLINKGLVSMNEFHRHPYKWEGKEIPLEIIDKLGESLPIRVYGKPNDELDDNFYINRFNPEICLDTYVSVVSEAHCGDSDQTMFLSEKIFKPIATRHPFMVMGNKDSMKKMREIGYKTFDNFIDQSYDSLPTHDRLQQLIECIRKIDNIDDKLSWFKSMESDIEHNYNVLTGNIFNKRVPALTILEEYYKQYFKIEINGTKKISTNII